VAKVIVVDDNPDAAASLAMVVEHMGHAVRYYTGGKAAVEHAPEFRPDLALIDLAMPGVNGFEVAEAVRLSCPDTFLVAVSGYCGEEVRLRADRAGFGMFLTKPIDPILIVGLLRRQFV
jgi:CheY-like chemotaxis protein